MKNSPRTGPRISWLTRFWAAVVLILGMASSAEAGKVTLAWDPSPDSDVVGYIVLYGRTPGIFDQVAVVGNTTTATIVGLDNGTTYYFTAAAFTASGLYSPLSNVASSVSTDLPHQLANPGPQWGAEGQDVVLALPVDNPDGDRLHFEAIGLPPGIEIDAATGVITGRLSFESAGSHSVTVTSADDTLSNSVSFSWSVAPTNRPPTLGFLQNRSSPLGTSVSVSIPGFDADGDPLEFLASGLPTGVVIDPSTGVISGTVESWGEYAVVIRLVDGGSEASSGFTWHVESNNVGPSLEALPNRLDPLEAEISLAVHASDADGNTLFYSATNLPPGVVINSDSGLIEGIAATAGGFDVSILVSDGAAIDTKSFTWTVASTHAPVLSDLDEVRSFRLAEVSFTLPANDADGDALTFLATGLPPGVSVNSSTGVVSGAPSTEGLYHVTVSVSDDLFAAEGSFDWTVVSNQRPALTNPGRQNTPAGADTVLELTATDDDGDTLEFTANGLPPGLAIDAETGVVSGTLVRTGAGDYQVSISVSDGHSADTAEFVWTARVDPLHAVQKNFSVQDSTSAVNVPYKLEQIGGDLNLVVIGWVSPIEAIPAVTDTNGNTYSLAVGPTTNPALGTQSIYYASNIAPASPEGNVITVTFSEEVQITDIRIAEYGGIDVGNPIDTVSGESGVGLVSDSGGAYTSHGRDFVVGANLLETWTAASGSGFTSRLVTPFGNILEDKVVSSAGYYNADVLLTGEGAWIMQMVALRAADAAPILTMVPDQTGAEGQLVMFALTASDPDGDAITYGVSGLPEGLTIDPASGLINGTLSYTSAGPHNVTVTVSDGSLSASREFVWTIADLNRAPTIVPVSDRNNTEGTAVSLAIIATDDDGDRPTFSASDLPPGLSINPNSGVVTGMLSRSSVGEHHPHITASDGTLSASVSFTWSVTAVNHPPTLTAPPDQEHSENTSVSLGVVATDPDGDTVTFSANGLPPGLTINPATGIITGALSFTSAGSYSVSVTVSDGTVTDGGSFTWNITNVNRPPTLDAVPDQAYRARSLVSILLTATDPDHDALRFSATGLPEGLSIAASFGTITGSPTPASAGANTIVLSVSDGVASATTQFVLTVLPEPIPAITSVSPSTGPLNGLTPVVIAGTDFEAGAIVRIGGIAATLVTVLSPTSITATTPAHAEGSADVTVVNPSLQAGTLSGGFTYVNSAPTITSISPQVIDEDTVTAALPFVIADDDTAAEGLIVTAASSNATLVPLSSMALSGTAKTRSVTVSPAANQSGVSRVTITVSDGRLSTAISFDLTVNAVNDAPSISALPALVTRENVATGAIAFTVSDIDNASASLRVSGRSSNPSLVPEANILLSGDGTDRTLIVTPSSNQAGFTTITVSVTDGTATSTSAFDLTVTPAVTVTGIGPTAGPLSGGTLVTVSGKNFVSGATVDIGGIAATDVKVIDAETLTARVPAHEAGLVSITVTNPDGGGGSLREGFRYGPTTNDLIIDFGAFGTWVLDGAKRSWSLLHPVSAKAIVTGDLDGNGLDDVVIDFGQYGLWVWSNNTTWWQLHTGTGRLMVTGDLDGDGADDVVVDFPGNGLWVYRAGTWTQLHPSPSGNLLTADLDGNGRQEVIVDFPGLGIWVWANDSAWWQLHPTDSHLMTAGDFDGDGAGDLVIDFPGYGVWNYRHSAWSQVSPVNASQLAAGDVDGNGLSDLVVDFGVYGIWELVDGSTWTLLHAATSAGVTVTDLDGNGKADVVINFGGEGLWNYSNNADWYQLHYVTPGTIGAGHIHP